jgi:hypothetical protein
LEISVVFCSRGYLGCGVLQCMHYSISAQGGGRIFLRRVNPRLPPSLPVRLRYTRQSARTHPHSRIRIRCKRRRKGNERSNGPCVPSVPRIRGTHLSIGHSYWYDS